MPLNFDAIGELLDKNRAQSGAALDDLRKVNLMGRSGEIQGQLQNLISDLGLRNARDASDRALQDAFAGRGIISPRPSQTLGIPVTAPGDVSKTLADIRSTPAAQNFANLGAGAQAILGGGLVAPNKVTPSDLPRAQYDLDLDFLLGKAAAGSPKNVVNTATETSERKTAQVGDRRSPVSMLTEKVGQESKVPGPATTAPTFHIQARRKLAERIGAANPEYAGAEIINVEPTPNGSYVITFGVPTADGKRKGYMLGLDPKTGL